MQLANTPPLQSTTPGLHPISFHQMAPPVRGNTHPITAYYSVYRPRKDERLSWPGWLVTYRNKVPPPGVEPGHVTHPSTNRARRRVTSLIRPTMLPLRHAANISENMLVTFITKTITVSNVHSRHEVNLAVICVSFQKNLAHAIRRMPELSSDIWCKLHYYEKARAVARFYSAEWNLTVNSSPARYNGHV